MLPERISRKIPLALVWTSDPDNSLRDLLAMPWWTHP